MRLLFVGDVMLGRLVNAVLASSPPGYPWGDTLPLIRQADARICNLECVIADQGAPWIATPKVFHFRSDAKNVATLKAASIDAVSLANNHVLDFGYAALSAMLITLEREELHFAGAGMTFDEAARPALWEVEGNRLGLLACTDNEPAWEATAERAGVWYVPIQLQDLRAQQLLESVRKTKAEVDLLIVSLHWGSNWGYAPEPEHPPFAHALIDAGADVVFGHSCHVVRGIEIYKKRPILYGTGDFIDDYAVDPGERNDQSAVFLVETEGATIVRLLLYPTVIRDFQVRRAKNQQRRAIVALMQRLCRGLNTVAVWNEQDAHLEIDIR
jgi:poly-gamma-glutamate capsule biosynthesis protein CapA/YwtB (metallophosphatase superfamily)